MYRPYRNERQDVHTNSFLLPDITPSAATPELEAHLKEAAYTIVREMSVPDICLRAGAEILVSIALAIIANKLMKYITGLARKVWLLSALI